MDLFKGLIDDKTLAVLKVFSDNPDEFFHINKVSDMSNVPLATTFRIMNNLLNHNIIEQKKISRFKIYTLARNKKTKKLRKLL